MFQSSYIHIITDGVSLDVRCFIHITRWCSIYHWVFGASLVYVVFLYNWVFGALFTHFTSYHLVHGGVVLRFEVVQFQTVSKTFSSSHKTFLSIFLYLTVDVDFTFIILIFEVAE